MKTKDKGLYESPTLEVVEMKLQGTICDLSAPALYLFLTDDPTSAEIDWGREGYGAGGGENTWN